MNAPPPPPPGPPPPMGVGSSPNWDRRTLRDQRRYAQVAARQQQALRRQRTRALRRSSVLAPLMLVGIGVLFLLLEVGTVRYDAVLLWMARWWPTLLLAAGLVLLAEWAVDTWVAGHNSPALPRRTVGAGGVFLLILLTATGLAAMGVHHSATWMQRNWDSDLAQSWGLDEMFAQHSQVDQDLSAPLAPGALLTVRNYRGDITVTGDSSDGLVHVAVHQRLVGWRSEDLKARKKRDGARLIPSAAGLLLTAAGEGRDRTDFTIQVPHESGIAIGGEAGQVILNEIYGPASVINHTGNVVLSGLTGPIHVSARDDDATITGHNLRGDVVLEGRSGDLAFSDVTGSMTLHGDFFGTSHLQRISGPIHFQSSFTDIACAGLPGELDVEGRSELQARDVEGPLVLTTTDRNLALSGVRHGGIITDRNGSVTLALSEPLAPVKVDTSAGSISVRVPEQASFALAAETAEGQVNNDFGLRPLAVGDHVSLKAEVHHGGPTLSLHTNGGDITIR